MNISELDDAALSRWIAEKLEPEPAANYSQGYAKSSLSGAWYRTSDFADWRPRRMVSDPVMTVMLLNSFPYETHAGGSHLHIGRTSDGWVVAFEPKTERVYGTLGRAVAEAFALANGWTE